MTTGAECLPERHFNPLPPHGGRLEKLDKMLPPEQFQSTPSAWRETGCGSWWIESDIISIHSLRMEGDYQWLIPIPQTKYFNPLPPHGGRRVVTIEVFPFVRHFNPLPPHGGRRPPSRSIFSDPVFQSTPSAWRETSSIRRPSIHLPHFNPLPPHGGRLPVPFSQSAFSDFNPLPPHGGRPQSH